jgi:TolA-binding protein
MEKSDEYNNRVLKLEPKHVSALYNRGAIAATRGDTETARDIWNRIVNDFPESETTALAKESLQRL